MKIKVSPDYEGAGSWETDAVLIAGRWRDESTHVEYPASWCEPIPEVVPQEGDIVEDFDGDIFVVEAVADGIYYRENGVSIVPSRVLARKPKEYMQAKDAIYKFASSLVSDDDEQNAYNKFLSAILGVPYGRVGG